MIELQNNYALSNSSMQDTCEEEELDFSCFFPVERLSVSEKEQVEKLINFLRHYEPEAKVK